MHIRSRLFALLLGLFLWVPALSAAPSAAREPATVVEVAATRFEVDAPVGMAGSIATAVRVIEQEWPGIATRVGVPAGGRVTVSAERDMNDWFARQGIPSQPPEWASGLTIPSRMTVLMAPANPEWERTMAHELAHIAVALATERRPVPRWFNEGYAMEVSHDWDVERMAQLSGAAVMGRLYPFDDLTAGYPAGAGQADLAYAQSFHMVRWLEGEFGAELGRRIFAEMRRSRGSWDAAFLTVTGQPFAAAEQAWLDYVEGRFHWLPVATGVGAGWVLVALLGLWAWRRRGSQKAAKLKVMERRQKGAYRADPDDTTFG